MEGSVSISIKDFQELLDMKLKSEERIEKTRLAAKELQVFLSFVCTRADIKDLVDEFNRQSKTCKIELNRGVAKIKFND